MFLIIISQEKLVSRQPVFKNDVHSGWYVVVQEDGCVFFKRVLFVEISSAKCNWEKLLLYFLKFITIHLFRSDNFFSFIFCYKLFR